MPIAEYNKPLGLTVDELIEQNIYLKTVNRGQAVYINSLEQEHERLINDSLRLARENDLLTDQVFESPMFFANEFVC